MDITNFRLSRHAIERALDMGIDGETIRECLANPTSTRPSRKYPGSMNYRRGDITCGVGQDGTVTTVVWSNPEGWTADLADKGAYAGREYRGAVSA